VPHTHVGPYYIVNKGSASYLLLDQVLVRDLAFGDREGVRETESNKRNQKLKL